MCSTVLRTHRERERGREREREREREKHTEKMNGGYALSKLPLYSLVTHTST